MFAGDTPQLVGVMASARHVARQLGHPRVRSEHLLAALADDHLGTASVLSRHGVSAAAAREAADAAGPSGAGVAADRSLLASLGIQAGSLLEAANIERPFGRQPQFPLGASVASRRCDAMTPPVGLDAQAAYEASLRVGLARRDQAHRPEHLKFVLADGTDRREPGGAPRGPGCYLPIRSPQSSPGDGPPRRPACPQRDAHRRPLRTAHRAQRSRPCGHPRAPGSLNSSAGGGSPTGADPGRSHATIASQVQDVVVSQLSVPVRLVASVRAMGPVGKRWLDELPGLLARLETEWSITCGAPFDGGNAAYVAEALTSDGVPAVLKVALPSGVDGFSAFEQELETLLLAQGDPYVAVIRHDTKRRSVLLERLGKPLASLAWSTAHQIDALTSTLARGWRPVTTGRLPTGAAKADWLAEFVTTAWADLGHPCSASAVERAVAFAAERAGSFEREGAVLVHGDGHAHNLLAVPGSDDRSRFRLTDPEGLVSEPAHDLGVVLRAWNEELLAADTAKIALDRCKEVASRSGVDAEAVWQWAFIERVSTGLFLLRLGHRAEAAAYLEVADRLAQVTPPQA